MALETNRLNFTTEVDTGLKNGDLSGVLSSLLARRKAGVLEIRKDMTSALRTQYNNLLVLYQAQLDVLRSLLEDDQKTIRSNAQSLWEKELRITQTPSGSLIAHCGAYSQPLHANLPHKSILVETELKRKMRLLFFQALAEKKSLSFHGPAGCGKTESVVDFCGELGLDFLRIDCSDVQVWNEEWVANQPNYGSNFVLIFDEFNRCDENQQKAISDKAKESGAQFCVTCNPGYPGRTKIDKDQVFGPDYLELEVSVPPFETIAKGMAACEGVVECEDLGVKLNKLIRACQETLSQQYQYDFGMRALKRIMQSIGSLVRDGKEETQAFCEGAQYYLMMIATKEDTELVQKLVKETFGANIDCNWNKTPSECVNWWFKNSKSTRNLNIMNCKNIDECIKNVEWSKKIVTIDCDPKDFNEKYVEEFHKAKETNEKILLIVKTQFDACTGESFNRYSDDNHPAPKTIRTVLFVNSLEKWSPAQISRIPSYFTK